MKVADGISDLALAATATATVDICLERGQTLVERCKSFRNVEHEIDDRIGVVARNWKHTSVQLDFLGRIWNKLDVQHQVMQDDILNVLVNKLTTAIARLGKLQAPSGGEGTRNHIKRWKYVFVKDSLDESLQDLMHWQQLFDPSWFLIMKMGDPMIDSELRNGAVQEEAKGAIGFRKAAREDTAEHKSIFLPPDGLNNALAGPISFCAAQYVRRTGSSGVDEWLVVDRFVCDEDVDIKLVTKDIRNLARKLTCADMDAFGLLQCRGVIRHADDRATFDFVFKAPKDLEEVTSLRCHLLKETNHSLSDRLALAKRVASSISYIHSLGFVHKSIRPETVLGFRNDSADLGRFYLIGFDAIRNADGRTFRQGDSSWEKNLYRHPSRQGLNPEDIYVMQHDIYSLGVCLLEIGIWKSFVSYDQSGEDRTSAKALGLAAGAPEFEEGKLMKQHLVELAKGKLPASTGVIYTDVVVNCLTCLDRDNPDFGDEAEFLDEDGVVVGVRYIEKVLMKLHSIVV